MASYKIAVKANADLSEIYKYTAIKFGSQQARTYFLELHECFQLIANKPMLGRSVNEMRPDLRRIEQRSHIVFYVQKEYGVRILRVLHQSMDAQRRL